MKVYRRSVGLGVVLAGCLFHAPSESRAQEPTSTFGQSNVFVVNTNRIGIGVTAVMRISSVSDDGGIPVAVTLGGTKPNPFNPRITLSFSVGRPGPVELNIYDLSGRCINRLISQAFEAGDFTHHWDGRDHTGHMMPAGVYLVRIKGGSTSDSKKITLVK